MSLWFEKAMFWSLATSIVFVPAWTVFGRTLLGGPGGWGTILMMTFVAPPLFVSHVVLFVLARRANNVYEQPSDYRITRPVASVLLAYYTALFFQQVFMDDGGDQGSTGSVATKYFGFDKYASDPVAAVFSGVSIVLLIAVVALVCIIKLPSTNYHDVSHHGFMTSAGEYDAIHSTSF
uniref:Uncharacterized protein n=1 Tax=Amphora coffeiformis TaxID=265554 RepID=A0A7S3L422_9STRA|mmetsp:Transcript_11435/g.21874  ORF Transcript_11435/g.21874 Transcript_11435/m.21874 type:complete len:178 (+) Transcript_11435:60-593(+)